jgi:hypothetical protein
MSLSRGVGLALALGVALPGAVVGQAVDTVRVTLEPERAVVEVRVPNLGDVVEAFALRFPDQRVEVTDVLREGEALLDATLTREEGALRFAVTSGAPVTVRYDVRGPLRRIPLFVPGGRAELTVARGVEEPFMVRVTGDSAALAAIDTRTSMPRFTRLADGALEVRLSSLPSFLRLSRGGPFSFSRIADALALALIALGAAISFRRLRRRGAARADGAGTAGSAGREA